MSLRHVEPENRTVLLNRIDPPELPSRSEMDEQKLEELTASIREHGLIQPIVLAPIGERFEIVAGHRRYLACFRAGLFEVPARIYPDKTAALIGVQYAENRFREDLNPLDEAVLFAQLLEQTCGGDVDTLCARLGEKRAYVEGRLALLELDERTQAALRAGKISIGVAQQLQKVTDPDFRLYYLDAALRGGATVAVVSAWVEQWRRDYNGAPKAPAAAPAETPAPSYAPENPFTCICCGGTDNVHAMRPYYVHDWCWRANMVPILKQLRGDEQ